MPTWVWRAIGGGVVALATAGVAVGHRIAKWRRQKQAREHVLEVAADQYTPRGNIPSTPPVTTTTTEVTDSLL